MFVLAWNLLRGRVGRALMAIRDHPIAATAMGINLPMFKSLTFGVSAAFTGVAGALGAIAVAFVVARQLHGRRCRSSCWSASSSAGWRRSAARSSAPSSSSSCPTSPTRSRSRRRAAIYGVLPDRPDVPDADRRDGHAAQAVGALAAGCRALARQRQARRSRSRTTRPTRRTRHEASSISVRPSRRRGSGDQRRRAAQKKYDTGADRQGDQDRPHQARTRARRRPTARSARRSAPTSTRSTPRAASTAARSSSSRSTTATTRPRRSSRRASWSRRKRCCFVFQPLGTPSNTAIQKYMNQQEGAAAVRRHRRHQVGRPEELPVDDGLAAELPDRGARSTPRTSWRPSPTPRSACSTRTTTTARTT